MKTPSDYPQVKFRPGKELTDPLAARSSEQTDSAYSQVAKQDLGDYYTLLSLCLPVFSHKERELLSCALNGWLATPETVQHLWTEVDTYLDTLPMAMIDGQSFVDRLRTLSRFECWAIVDALKRGVLCPAQ
jgi:hypothetical protein